VNKVMATCLAVVAFCGTATAALATPMPSPAQGTSNAMHAMAEMPATLAQLQNEIQSVVNNFDAVQAQTLRNQAVVQSGVSAQKFPDSAGG
jgi:hypothetical protein